MIRDLFVLFVVLASVPVCFLWPWLGGVLWGWLGFLAPHRLLMGRTFEITLGWLPVGATLIGLVWSAPHSKLTLPRTREMGLLFALWGFCGLTTALAAIYPEIAWRHFIDLSRVLAMILVVMSLSMERRKLTLLLWLTALSVGFYAFKGSLWVLLTGGAEPLDGPRASDIENNNDFAAALIAVAPFFVFLGRDAETAWVRHGRWVLFGATVLAILGTYSRAAVLALVAMLALLAVFRQWRVLAVGAAAFAVFLLFASPQKLAARVDTIRTYDQDESASMRLREWTVALGIGFDHPWLGAGFGPFSAETHQRYNPGSTDHRDAHNLFLQVFAEHGFPGLALYLALVVSTLVTLWRRARPASTETTPDWVRDAARALFVGLVGYIVDGQFHCISYRPIFFDLIALSIMLDALARLEGLAPRGQVPLRGAAV